MTLNTQQRQLCYQIAIKPLKTCGFSLQVMFSCIIMRYTGRYWKHVGDWAEDDGQCTQTRPKLGAVADEPDWFHCHSSR